MILSSIPPSDHLRAEQQHRLILSIKAPLDQEDLFQPSNCTTQIKRGSNKYLQQKVAFFIMPPTFPNAGTLENAKTPWVPNIKEGTTTTICLCAKKHFARFKGLGYVCLTHYRVLWLEEFYTLAISKFLYKENAGAILKPLLISDE